MARFTMLAGALVSAVFMGCAAQTEAPTPAFEEAKAVVKLEPTIHDVRHPGTPIVAGASVRLAGEGIKITAATPSKIWIQEAADQGACELGASAVAWRAITVELGEPHVELAPGQRVIVEGKVDGVGASRRIVNAIVTTIGPAGEPYPAHCDRDGATLADDALDAVLVTTAGMRTGPATLETCFAATDIMIDESMVAPYAWRPTWHWITGVLDRKSGNTRLEPRDARDIVAHGHDDACL